MVFFTRVSRVTVHKIQGYRLGAGWRIERSAAYVAGYWLLLGVRCEFCGGTESLMTGFE